VTGQLRSELRKLRTTRTTATLLLAAVALTALGTSIEAWSSSPAELATEEQQRMVLGAGAVGGFLATLAGLLVVTSEFRYGTIRPTLLVQPRRRVVLLAKLGASALVGVVFAAVCVALSLGGGLAMLAVRDVGLAVSTGELIALVLGTTIAGALTAMLGVGIGTLIRNQVGAIVAVVAYAFLLDATVFAALPSVGRFLPGKAGDALAGSSVEHLLTPAVGGAVLVAWTSAFVVAASLRNERTDI
jgi:ABC-type transport system involved in multi-copper enzyme maturation permease subunit